MCFLLQLITFGKQTTRNHDVGLCQKSLKRNTLIITNLLVYIPKVTTVHKSVYICRKQKNKMFTKFIKL